jgi:hypothetical protein
VLELIKKLWGAFVNFIGNVYLICGKGFSHREIVMLDLMNFVVGNVYLICGKGFSHREIVMLDLMNFVVVIVDDYCRKQFYNML